MMCEHYCLWVHIVWVTNCVCKTKRKTQLPFILITSLPKTTLYHVAIKREVLAFTYQPCQIVPHIYDQIAQPYHLVKRTIVIVPPRWYPPLYRLGERVLSSCWCCCCYYCCCFVLTWPPWCHLRRPLQVALQTCNRLELLRLHDDVMMHKCYYLTAILWTTL